MDWRFAIIAFVVFPIAVLPVIGVARRVRKMYRGAQKKLADITTLMQEAIQGCRVVKAFAMEEYECARFRDQLARQLRMLRRVLRIGSFTDPLIEVLGARHRELDEAFQRHRRFCDTCSRSPVYVLRYAGAE